MDKKRRIFYLDAVRVFAIISVSLNHAVNRAYDNYIDTASEFYSSSIYSSCLKAGVSVFSRLGVPLFLMISGILLLNKIFEDEGDIKRFYKHNVGGLLITSEIWFFIMFWINAFFNPSYAYLIDNIKNGQAMDTVIALVKTLCFIDPITFGNMWYIPMILCVYMIIPVVAVFVKKIESKFMLIPLALCVISGFVLPNINAALSMRGVGKQYSFTLSTGILFSIFWVYVVMGYLIDKGCLSRLSTPIVIGLTAVLFLGDWVWQMLAYAGPTNYLVSYDFIGILACSIFLFELFRRKGEILEKLLGGGQIVSYLSRITFGIFFLHAVINMLIYWGCADKAFFLALPQFVRLIIYEIIPVLGSILIIALLSRVKWMRKYVFMVK